MKYVLKKVILWKQRMLQRTETRVCKYETGISPPVKYFTDHSKAVLILCIFYVFFFCPVFAMPLCVSVYLCLVVTCWERADLLALICCV